MGSDQVEQGHLGGAIEPDGGETARSESRADVQPAVTDPVQPSGQVGRKVAVCNQSTNKWEADLAPMGVAGEDNVEALE
jgi:hypothetical protein